jgi:hypothetical protein
MPWSRGLSLTLMGPQLVRKYPHLMEPKGSYYHIQNPILRQINPVHAPPPTNPTSRRSTLILSSHLCLGFLSGHIPSGFRTKTLYGPLLSPIWATCPAHLSLLDLITQVVCGEEYRTCSSLLCSLLHSSHTSSLLGPSTLLSTLFSKTLSLVLPQCQQPRYRNFHRRKNVYCGLQGYNVMSCCTLLPSFLNDLLPTEDTSNTPPKCL